MNIKDAMTCYQHEQQKQHKSVGTIREYQKDLGHFVTFLSNKSIDTVQDVTSLDMQEYLQAVLDKGAKASTRNRQMNSLRSFFKYCHKKGWVTENCAAYLERLPEEQVKRVILTKEEVQQLVKTIEHRVVRTVVITLYLTGMRITECLSVEIQDINVEGNQILIRKGKGNKQRSIPLHPQLKRILIAYLLGMAKHSQHQLLFYTSRSNKLSPSYVNRLLKEATLTLGWDKKVTCHVLRHSFASALLKEQVNLLTIQDFLGHANLKTTSGYVHLFQEEGQAAIQKLAL